MPVVSDCLSWGNCRLLDDMFIVYVGVGVISMSDNVRFMIHRPIVLFTSSNKDVYLTFCSIAAYSASILSNTGWFSN